MDDLDHSIHISEFDWCSFFTESEECGLPHPALACLDDSSLTDSEESVSTDSVLNTSKEETQQSTDADRSRADRNCSTEDESCTREPKENAEEDVTQAEICLEKKTGEDIPEEKSDDVTNTLQSENVQSSEEPSKDRSVQTGSDLEPSKEPDPLSCNQTGLSANEALVTEGAASDVPLRAEKERWFVTVNDNPARKRERVACLKKKRRQRKHCDGSRTLRAGQEKPFEINEERRQLEEEKKSQSNQSLANKTEERSNSEIKTESLQVQMTSDSSQLSETSGEEDDVSEKLSIAGSRKEHITGTMLISDSQDTFTGCKCKQPECAESDQSDSALDDSAEFLSTQGSDSESYLSATESMEEPHRSSHRSSSSTSDNCAFTLSDRQETHTRSCDGIVLSNVSETDSEGHQSRTPELSLTFPSPKMSADDPPWNNDAHSASLCVTPDTSVAPTNQTHLSASGCSQEDQLTLPLVPDLTVTPCSVADTPEAFAQAAGQARPVYAISAFWAEMEKLTINDILQLRMRRSSPPAERQESVTQTDGSLKVSVSPVDAVEYSLSGMDQSDTADSDYFTQADESKPDRSSCEFSTSDFEEEYWQFVGASRNTSPDPHSKKQENDPSFLQHEEESAGSEGKQTLVPSEEPEGPRLDSQECLILSELPEPRQIIKNKSMRNVQACLTLSSSFCDDEGVLSLSPCETKEENVILQVSDRPMTLNDDASFLCSSDILDARYQISFPEVFEYFFSKDKGYAASQCVKVYDPEDFSVAPIFDFPLSPLRDEIFSSSLLSSSKHPIPIFSCSHPTVRDLTFPKLHYVFLSSNSEGAEDISPIRVVSQSYIQADQHGSYKWKSLLSIRKIRFHDKGSMWCGRSGVWMFPAEEENLSIRDEDPVVTMLGEEDVSPASSELFRELKEQQRVLGTIQTKRDNLFSTLKQSDMCLVCIAFASWVLKSSDPEAADAWKAALLANVSALSAIQYLRQYVKKKKHPLQDEP